MDKNYNSIEIECECGEIHTLLPMIVIYDSYEKVINLLKSKNVLNLRIFVQDNLKNLDLYFKFHKKLVDNKINYHETILSESFAEVYKANSIVSTDEDYIIVFGEYSFIELIKYYACSISVDYSIMLSTSFFDFTFSRFARVYDGVSYDFYKVQAPDVVIVWEELLEKLDIQKYKLYLKLKDIAYFENILSLKIDDKSLCGKINLNVFKIKTKAKMLTSGKDILNAMIFLGRSMSLFNQSKAFFGAELDITNTLEILTKKPFLDLYLLSSKVCCEIYNKAIFSRLRVLNLNLNKRIDKIKQCLKLPVTKALQIIKPRKDLSTLVKTSRILNALKYMLSNLIENKSFETMLVDSKTLSNAIYLAPEFSSRYNFLNFIRDIGYLENLI